MNYKPGLVSISFRQYSPKEIIIASKNAGLTCIEWGSDVHAPKDDISALNEIRALQEKYDIVCCSYGTYFRLGVNPIDELPEYIKAAKILGTNILRLWCGSKNSQDYDNRERMELFNECKRAAEIAQREEVILCMECHNFTYTNEVNSAVELMEFVDSPYFRMYWQPNQYKSKFDNLIYANAISKYTEHLHVFNWEGDARFPLAEKIDEWKEYLKIFEGNRALLLEFVPDDKIETLACEADALKKIIR